MGDCFKTHTSPFLYSTFPALTISILHVIFLCAFLNLSQQAHGIMIVCLDDQLSFKEIREDRSYLCACIVISSPDFPSSHVVVSPCDKESRCFHLFRTMCRLGERSFLPFSFLWERHPENLFFFFFDHFAVTQRTNFQFYSRCVNLNALR